MNILSRKQVIHSYGSPSVFATEHHQLSAPGAGEVLIATHAIGVNFSDVLRRRNTYFMPTPLPFVLGAEAVGEIVAVGDGVGGPFVPGTRVLAAMPGGGAYATHAIAQAAFCIPLPPHVQADEATGIFVQGSTAALLAELYAESVTGKFVLVNAAAGGVGSLLVQLLKQRGAQVIAGVGSDAKFGHAKSLGADFVANYGQADFAERLQAFTTGNGIDLAFEMVGGQVYDATVRALKEGGSVVVYGCAGGAQGAIHPEYFVDRHLTQYGFNLAHCIGRMPERWQAALGSVIEGIASGSLKVGVSHRFALDDVAEAHRQIEARKTVGKVVLIP